MIIDGNFNSLNITGSFDMKNRSGAPVFRVERNKYMSSKIYISSPDKNIEYLGEVMHSKENDEFALYEDDAEILRIKQISSLGVPKFDISSPFGDFSAKYSIMKKTLFLYDGTEEVLTFNGTASNYTMNIDDNCNTFYVMSIAYGITTLLNIQD